MVSQFFKKKSKRISTKQREMISKKVRLHKRKLKKQAKRSGEHKRKRKDPGVPNSLPFKESVLKDAEIRKQRLQTEREEQKKRQKESREKKFNEQRSLVSLVTDAQKRNTAYDKSELIHASGRADGRGVLPGQQVQVELSLKTFYKEFKKVVDNADVILEILDARDPIGSRCHEVEQTILNSGTKKRLVLVLNKIDLVPRENVEAWLKHLRNEFPTIAFKASTQSQKDRLGRSKVPLRLASDELTRSSQCLGAEMLMKLLGNYCRSIDIRTSIRVGVVGFPNTGKSSVINSLKRSRACSVGASPGITRQMQVVQLDRHIRLLDSPGIVMSKDVSDTANVLRNCIRLSSLDDPIPPVDVILKRCNKMQLMLHYKITDYRDVHEFLSLLAIRYGDLRKGGIPNQNKAAKKVLKDWTSGKITYFTQPPEQSSLPTHVSAEMVSEMSAAFNLESIAEDDKQVFKGLPKRIASSCMEVESLGPLKGILTEEDARLAEAERLENVGDDEEMDEDDDDELKSVTVSISQSLRNRQSSLSKAGFREKKAATANVKGNQQANRARKADFKKMKKDRKRADKLAASLSESLTGAMDSVLDELVVDDKVNEDEDGDYNFEIDFT